jgi:thiol-disulfide isomerase/thioredoxin
MNGNYKKIISTIVVLGVLGAIIYLEAGKPEQSSVTAGSHDIDIALDSLAKEEKAKTYEVGKEISTPDGFINTDFDGDGKENGITISELIGNKIVLVDFWTYSCINCQRTTPYLNAWYEKYKDDGLVILGIHTPEFEFEKEYANVTRAVEKFEIEYPVILDNDYSTWNSYLNKYWPRKYLLDVDGFIVYEHIGEGGYDETEAVIVKALNELKERNGEAPITVRDVAPEGIDVVDTSKPRSPETYLGASRVQYIANLPSLDCLEGSCEFPKVSDLNLNTYSLFGTWRMQPEEAVLESGNGSIFLKFTGNKVNLVAGSETGVTAEIYLDGERIPESVAGGDVEGGSVLFKENQLYNLVDLRGEYGEHTLEIRFLDAGVSAFAFTFG